MMVNLSMSVCVEVNLSREVKWRRGLTQGLGVAWSSRAPATETLSRRRFASRPANDGPPELRAAFTSQDLAGSVCVSGVKRYVAGEAPSLLRCSGIR